ncbi:MAG TPA: MFS transporter, partial [Myxococcaceae bacterium]|nr:MFS transporter [Myxococcaceae bacterium]
MPPSQTRNFRSLLSHFAALATSLPSFRPGVPGLGATLGLVSFALSGGPFSSKVRGKLRRSLIACTSDGIFAEVVTALTTGTVLTAWALHLRGNAFLIGLLAAIPFLCQIIHLPAAWMTSTWGYRKVALFSIAWSRRVFWLLAPLPFLPVSDGVKQAVLVAVALGNGVFGVVGNNAWVAWMGELVPESLRGRYFGRRNALSIVGGTVATFVAALILDGANAVGGTHIALAILATAASLSGQFSVWCIARQHVPHGAPAATGRMSLSATLKPFLDRETWPFLVYTSGWNSAVALAAAFFPVYMITYLKMNFLWIAAHAAGSALFRVLTSHLWGRALDRLGARPILVFCSFGITVIPLIWLFPTENFLWPVVVDAVVGGVLWAGHAIAAFSLPLTLAPKGNRPYYLAAFTATGGIFYAVFAVGGGALATALPERMVVFDQPII